MAAPSDPKRAPQAAPPRPPAAAPPPARTSSADSLPAVPAGELGLPAMPRYTGPDPKVCCGLARLPGPSDQTLEVAAHVTAEPVAISLGADAIPALRGPVRTRLDLSPPPGEKAAPAGGAAAFDLELALTRFQDRAYAVARAGPGVDLTDSTESTATGLQKVAWKLPRPC